MKLSQRDPNLKLTFWTRSHVWSETLNIVTQSKETQRKTKGNQRGTLTGTLKGNLNGTSIRMSKRRFYKGMLKMVCNGTLKSGFKGKFESKQSGSVKHGFKNKLTKGIHTKNKTKWKILTNHKIFFSLRANEKKAPFWGFRALMGSWARSVKYWAYTVPCTHWTPK